MKATNQIKIIFSIFIFYVVAQAQNAWYYTPKIMETNSTVVTVESGNMTEDINKNIYLFLRHKNTNSQIKNEIYKLNKDGQFLLKTSSEIVSSDSLIYLNLFMLQNQHLLAFGVVCKSNEIVKEIWIGEFDTNLNLIKRKKYFISGPVLSIIPTYRAFKSKQNTFVFYLGFNELTYEGTYVKLFEIDMMGDLMRQANYKVDGYVADFIQDPVSLNYKGFVQPFLAEMAIIHQYNSTFNMIGTTTMNVNANITFGHHVKYINNKQYINDNNGELDINIKQLNVKCGLNNTVAKKGIAVIKVNANKDSATNCTCIKKTNEALNEYSFYRIAEHQSIDFVDSNKIYITGTYFLGSFSYINTPSYIICSQMNQNLEFNWTLFYGGNMNYRAIHTIATKDGGVLISGHYQTNTMSGRDGFLLKIGPNGEVLNTNELPKGTQVFSYLVGPNPVQNVLNIQGFTPNTTIHIVKQPRQSSNAAAYYPAANRA